MRDVAAFVAFAPMGDGGKVWRVCLEDDSLKRDIFDGFCDRCLLVGEYSSDADVPVSEFLQFALCLCASAVGVENSPQIKISVVFQYFDYQLC